MSSKSDFEVHPAANRQATDALDRPVEVRVTPLGPGEYLFEATSTFHQSLDRVWAAASDFERLIAVSLPGMATDFQWLNGGGPRRLPAVFQFTAGSEIVQEELYELNDAEHSFRYRLLRPALGMLEYDGTLRFESIAKDWTEYSAVRRIKLEASAVEGLKGLIALETQNLKDYFAKTR